MSRGMLCSGVRMSGVPSLSKRRAIGCLSTGDLHAEHLVEMGYVDLMECKSIVRQVHR